MSPARLIHQAPEAIVARVERALDPVAGDHRRPRRSDFDLDEVDAPAGRRLRPAAVLALMVRHPDRVTLLFTKRADHLQAHAGQISFPGGRQNVGRETLAECALRETEEEIGLAPEKVRLLGRWDAYETVTGFAVTPFVGIAEAGFEMTIDPGEVAEVFETPFDFLMNPANHRLEEREFRGVLRRYYAMPWKGRYIWGATAGMLKALSERLARTG
ncbi:NUDIX hydrolase [Marinicauda salina]|uniref:NUDIX hydrolase n=1 Tax=Marinicauda salina TaxID=2135793 RepID=UPI001E4749E1|nr:CoA pyrophosphatase [Marinicauda salina]